MPIYKPAHLTQQEWLEERFWKGVAIKGPDDCWLWTKSKVTDGYGTITYYAGVPVATHVLSYEIENGKVPKGKIVRHICDNPPCCNPKHLVLGTSQDNAADMLRKNRNPKQKITAEIALKIREDKRKHRIIAAEYDISQSMVRLIQARKRWSDKMIKAMGTGTS